MGIGYRAEGLKWFLLWRRWTMPYGVAARDYLARAKARLIEQTQEGLFYAAFELRCCIETRQEDYANAIEFEKLKIEAWRIGVTARQLQKFFDSEKVARISMGLKRKEQHIFHYTPVTKELSKMAERAGEILHRMNTYHSDESEFWFNTRSSVTKFYRAAWLSCQGTLMAPPIFKRNPFRLHPFVVENPSAELKAWIGQAQQNATQLVLDVRYFDTPPQNWVCDL